MAGRLCEACGEVYGDKPNCAACGYARMKPWGWLPGALVLAVVVLLVNHCMFSSRPSTRAEQIREEEANGGKEAQDLRDVEAAARLKLREMKRPEALAFLSERMLTMCRALDPNYNGIRVVQMRGGLFCRHDFYNQYEFSAGPEARAFVQFREEWAADLKRNRVTKVGMWGEGEYADGTWYDVR